MEAGALLALNYVLIAVLGAMGAFAFILGTRGV